MQNLRINIKNFRCLKSVSINLSDFNIIIGKNDTGKSSFLDALFMLGAKGDIEKTDIWKSNFNSTMIIETIPEDITKQIYIKWEGNQFGFGNFQLNINKYDLPSTGPSMLSSGYSDNAGAINLDKNGAGVPALIDYYLRRDRERFFNYVNSAKQIITGLADIDVATPKSNERQIVLVMEDGFKIPADNTSVGVKNILFFLALAYHPEPPHFILIEEPEKGVHPRRLGKIISLLRDMIEGKHSTVLPKIIITTHSPYLLDFVDLKKGLKYQLKFQIIRTRKNISADGIVAVVDRDKDKKREKKKSLLEGRKEGFNNLFPTAIGFPDPHIESWLLDDHKAVKNVLKLDGNKKIISVENSKYPKNDLTNLRDESCRSGEKRKVIWKEIAEIVNIKNCRKPEKTGFKSFYIDVKDNLT